MKRLIPIMLCLVFVFGGIAGCATTQTKPEAPVVAIPDEAPVVATFVDVKFVEQEKKVGLVSCENKQYYTKPHRAFTTDSEGVERPTSLAAVWDPDCKVYGLFLVQDNGRSEYLGQGDTLEDLRLFILSKIKGRPIR